MLINIVSMAHCCYVRLRILTVFVVWHRSVRTDNTRGEMDDSCH